MLSATRIHYKAASAEFISTNSITDYLTKAQAWIENEGKRADSYLDPSTKPKLLTALNEEVGAGVCPPGRRCGRRCCCITCPRCSPTTNRSALAWPACD